jgi:CheY-like chemotaxis protein
VSLREILVVEDDEAVQVTLQMLIEGEGYAASTANNGKEAIDKLMGGLSPCLILLDLMMPVMSGWEFMDHMNEHYASLLSRTKVVILSAAQDGAKSAESLNCSFLKKPINMSRLIAILGQYCNSNSPSHG